MIQRLLLVFAVLFTFQMAQAATKSVFFTYPKDGATVPTKFKAKFGVKGMEIKPAGVATDDKNSGHFHIIVDADAVADGQVIPADAQHIHYGKGQTEGEITLTPGSHTLTLQFADGLHKGYSGDLVKKITVTAK